MPERISNQTAGSLFPVGRHASVLLIEDGLHQGRFRFRHLFKDKVRARFQLNARNLQEWHARLQPVGSYPDGSYSTFRVIEPVTFIFTASFDL